MNFSYPLDLVLIIYLLSQSEKLFNFTIELNPAKMKRKTLKSLMKRVKIVVDPNMVKHDNDPVILRKAEEARRTIEKYGLPKEILERKRVRALKEKTVPEV